MGKSGSVWWIVVEFACRILGVSTATVLCAVGVETLQQGEFNSLGIYLLVSSAGIMLLELAYFLDVLLIMCLPFPPDWQIFVLWGKMAHVGGFHKFLYYSIMSVVCFLHPVLVWHAVIPGTMLLITAFFNFILSKKPERSPKRPQERNSDQSLTTVHVTEGGSSDSSLSFFHVMTGQRGAGPSLSSRELRLGPAETGESEQAMLELQQTTAPKDADRERRRRRWREGGLMCFRAREEPVEREMEEMDGYCETEPDTNSDTAPMITD